MGEDVYARSTGMAAHTVISRLLHRLSQNGVLTNEEIDAVLSDAQNRLRQNSTEITSGAIAIVDVIAGGYREPPLPRTTAKGQWQRP